MKRLLLIVTIINICSGCGKGPNHIDPTFQPIYDQFISDAHDNGLDLDEEQGITIQFGDTGQVDYVGLCSSIGLGGDGRTITIQSWYWNSSTEVEQLLLIYHELGHCVLGEVHVTDPNEIMYPYVRTVLEPNMIPDLMHRKDQIE